MKLKLNIACDDVNPLKGYRILGDKTETWFRKLNEDYGVKFTLFCPSNYHNQAPISQHKEWIQELHSIEWLELAAHGLLHDTSDRSKWGECEMFEPNPLIAGVINDMLGEWYDSIGYYPRGFRPPGWLCSENAKNTLEKCFDYVAIHYEHNQGMQWNCKTFFGHDGIQQENISIHNEDMIMFQSHIYGKHNHNVWNEQNYDQLRMSLDHLFENFEINPVLLKECLND